MQRRVIESGHAKKVNSKMLNFLHKELRVFNAFEVNIIHCILLGIKNMFVQS